MDARLFHMGRTTECCTCCCPTTHTISLLSAQHEAVADRALPKVDAAFSKRNETVRRITGMIPHPVAMFLIC